MQERSQLKLFNTNENPTVTKPDNDNLVQSCTCNLEYISVNSHVQFTMTQNNICSAEIIPTAMNSLWGKKKQENVTQKLEFTSVSYAHIWKYVKIQINFQSNKLSNTVHPSSTLH